jgi:hypothetical protein
MFRSPFVVRSWMKGGRAMLVVRTEVSPSDRKGATDRNYQRITAIDAEETLGYFGRGREEHSGENEPVAPSDLVSELADNAPDQVLEEELVETKA